MTLDGRVAVVTGASRGIGRTIAAKLAQNGASVVINYANNEADAIAAVENMKNTLFCHLNKQFRFVQIRANFLIDDTIAAFVKLAILVLNAGILRNQSLDQIAEDRVKDMSCMKSFDRSINVNVKGHLFLIQLAVPKIKEGGCVIFISSTLTAFSGIMPNYTRYATTKGAIELLSRTLAKDLGHHGITVNTVSPNRRASRLGVPEGIANVVAFIAGPDSAWVNGQNIRANGGYVV
ncbi:hypothetical protein THRCLA_22458 [Thraustotheca clavata]|uniref:Uncharacterized protein n=1 Tax=Thraustotheca clavata TaxID=74557 RepID=A0A1V9Z0P9_9STRA|nr:hypothetical protein THRCLA_22458 [Thraustotheca clavata]